MGDKGQKFASALFAKYRHYGEEFVSLHTVQASKPTEKKSAKRYLALGDRRMFLIKKATKISKAVIKMTHFYDLKELSSSAGNTVTITYRTPKGEKQLQLVSSDAPQIVAHLRSYYHHITPDFADHVLMRYSGDSDAALIDIPCGEVAPIHRVYVSQCGYFRSPVSREFSHFLEDMVASGRSDLNFCECPGMQQRTPIQFDMTPVIASLRHSKLFTSLVIANVSMKEVVAHVANIVRHNTALGRVVLSGLDTNKAFILLGGLIAANKRHSISSLTLSGSKISNDGVDSIAHALEKFPHALRELDLSHCQLSGARAEALVTAFECNYGMSLGIEVLNLSHNRFELSGSQALERWLHNVKEHARLRVLNLSHSNLNMTSVCRSFRSLRFLEDLDVSRNKIDLGACKLLCVMIEHSSTLRRLSVAGCSLRVEDLSSIVHCAVTNQKLAAIELDISENAIASKDITLITAALRNGWNLRALHLCGLKLKPENFRTVLKSLRKAVILDTLVLDDAYCDVADRKVGLSIAGLLECVPAIQVLSLRNSFKSILVDFLGKFCSNTSLLELDIGGNCLKDRGAYAVAQMLRENSTLGRLEVDENEIGFSGWKSLRLALARNRTLVCLPYPWKDLEAFTKKCSDQSRHGRMRQLLADVEKAVALNSNEACAGRVWSTRKDANLPLSERLWNELEPMPRDAPPAVDVPPHLLQLQQEARLQRVAMPLEAFHGAASSGDTAGVAAVSSFDASASTSVDSDSDAAMHSIEGVGSSNEAMSSEGRSRPPRPPPPSSLSSGGSIATGGGRPPPRPPPPSHLAPSSVPLSRSMPAPARPPPPSPQALRTAMHSYDQPPVARAAPPPPPQ